VIVCERFGFAQRVFKPATAAADAASKSKPLVELMRSSFPEMSRAARG
jgi:hypothetical protein